MTTTIYLLLGGNEGDRQEWLDKGRAGIRTSIGDITGASGIYETAAWGKEDQAAFLNQVVEVKTRLTPRGVLERITEIERATARRIRTEKWAARTLDIDILFYGDAIVDEAGLTIPHPHLQQRRFALTPLCEIAPALVHPVLHQSCMALLQLCSDPLDVTLI